jgi:chemotaxis protein histidine kinase CheA
MSETQVTTEAQIDISDDLDAFSNDFFGQKPEVEDKAPDTTTEAAEQENTEDQTSEDTEAQDEQDEAEAQEEIPDKPKRKTVQDRIDEVVRQREELKRESAAEIAKLRQELEDFKKSQTQVEVESDEANEPQPDALDKDGEPVYALGEFDPLYIRDLTRFTLEQERTKAQAEQAEAQRVEAAQKEQQALQTQWNTKLEAATQEYPDLVEKSQTLLNGFTDLDQGYAGYLSMVLMSMDKGPEVLYYLASHPDEATAIVNSGAQRATLALGRIEARFLQDEQPAVKPKVSKAPAPPTERARGTNGAFVSVAPDTDDLDAFASEFFRKK